MNRRKLCAFVGVAALLSPLATLAENSTSAGGYTIHHNAFGTDTLTPEVAKAYGIQRSKYRGMLNVSVIKDEAGGAGKSVPGRVEVNTVELTGQANRLPMREIREGDAIYYVGEVAVQNEQKVSFAIEVTPEGSSDTINVKMDQQFFTD